MATPFRLGTKRVYLPNTIFTLVRGSGKLPANQAMFHVPLKVNKFDVRDYLYNLYGLVTTSVKTMIQQSPLQRGTQRQRARGLHFKRQLQMSRPASSKRVIVTMEEPFT
jgi:large subunit ribosomal protein L23